MAWEVAEAGWLAVTFGAAVVEDLGGAVVDAVDSLVVERLAFKLFQMYISIGCQSLHWR